MVDLVPSVVLGEPHSKHYLNPQWYENHEKVVEHMHMMGIWGGRSEQYGIRIDENRNDIIQDFLKKSKCEWLLFLDDDMLFPRNVAEVMVRSALREDAPIVCGLYFHTMYGTPHLYRESASHTSDWHRASVGYDPLSEEVHAFLKDNDVPSNNNAMWLSKANDQIIDIDAGGTGLSIIHRSVFEKMDVPWFKTEVDTGGDLMFFKRAKDLGIKIVGDMSIIAGHLITVPYGVGHFYTHMGQTKSGTTPGVTKTSKSEAVPA